MPYRTYGVTPAAAVPPMATAVSKLVASSSPYIRVPEPMPRRYEDGYHRPAAGVYMSGIPGYAAPEPCYTMPPPGFTSLSGLRGPESCGGRSRGSGRSSNRSLTRSEIREALRGATSEIVGDLTEEIWAKLVPRIPPPGSPTIVGVSPHRVQANHLVAGLTTTLGSLQCFDLEEYYHESDFDPVCGVPCSWTLPFCSFGETSFEKQSRFSISTTSKGHQKLFLVAECNTLAKLKHKKSTAY